MTRKNLPPSAFALPGLSSDKPKGLRNKQRDCFTTDVPQKNGPYSTSGQQDDSPSLVDDLGEFLAPETGYTLGNLTKSRPRSPGRRSPSPLARRKFDDSADVNDQENVEKSTKDERIKNDRLKALEERSSFSPSLILMNDVGLSVSSSSLGKPSPKTLKRNQENHSGSRLRSHENGELEAEREARNATTGAKMFDEMEEFGGRNNEPPSLPSVPPPLEDDFVSHKEQHKTFVKAERSLLVNKADNTQPNRTLDQRSDRRSFSSSGASGDGHSTASEKSRSLPRPGIGVERTLSEDAVLSTLPRIGAVSLDKQISFDSGMLSRRTQPQTSWSSRQRNLVEKNPSARRRRFKPVTLSDEVDSKDTNTSEPKQDLPSNSNSKLSGTKYMYRTDAFDSPDKTKIPIPVVNSPGSLDMGYSMVKHGTSVNENLQTLNHTAPAKEVANKSVLSSEANNVVNNNMPFSTLSEKGDQSKRANLDTMVVFQYDNSPVVNITDKDNTVKKLPYKSLGTASSDSKPRQVDSVIDFVSSSGKSIDSSHHLKAPSVTLPKVVIEYDGMVINDPVVDGYDTAETSSDDSVSLLTSSSVAANGFHGRDDTGTFIEDVEDLNVDEEDQTLEAEPVKEETTKGKGVEHFEDGEDGLMYHSSQAITKVSHFDGDDDNEMLFEPPPMFASSDEDFGVDLDDEREEAEEEKEREAYYDMRSSSPAIPPVLLAEQIRDNRPFHNLALEAWTEEDCIDWLVFIGLGHFTEEFQEHHVDGKMLKNVNFQLLEEIGINSPDEREVILSEIYRRFHPEEEDMFEMEVQGALESASEQEKDKIMAVLHALRSPAFQAELGMTSSTGSSSPHDSDTGYQVASETVSLSSSMTGSDDHPRDDAMPPPPPPPTWTQSLQRSEVKHSERETSKSRDSTIREEERLFKTSKGKEKQTGKEIKREKHGHKHKRHKGVAKLLDSLSLSSGSSKLTKLFHSSSSSTSKKLNPAMQYLLQAGPQGLVRVWPMALSEEMNYCSFLVSITTTCSEVVKLVFDKYEVVDDPRRFHICEVNLGKGGVSHNLSDDDCPLLYQCRWHDPEKYRFELRCRDEGVIKMLFELDEYEGDLDYRSIPLSMKTPCSEALKLIVKKFDLPGDVSDYFLMEVSEENEDDREEVADHVYPLRLQRAWSAPDHVFRLCRRPSVVQDGSKENIWIGDTTNDISEEEPNIYPQSEASSVRDEDEVESTPDMDGIEEDAVVEDTAHELMEGLGELESDDSNSPVETEILASEELRKARQELLAREYELKELKLKSNALSEKQREIEDLQRLNEELKTRCEELGELPVIKKKLVERERDFERLRAENDELHGRMSELEEKSKKEIAFRDREIERLHSRNNELCSKEKEIQKLKEKSEAYDSQEEELEKLRLLQHESSSNQNELVRKLEELQNRHSVMLLEVSQVEELKRINRELCQKVDEREIVRQKLNRSELERNELGRKLEGLERKNRELEAVYDEVERLRKENHKLAVKSKDADEMKQNIIKLSAQLREMESHDDLELLRKKIEQSEAEKKQFLEKLAELEKQESKMRGNLKRMEDLKLENIFLVERSKEVDELKNTVAKLTAEVRENESFRQKYKELRDVESYLTKQTSSLENTVRQKDRKLKELENKVKSLTESGKDMEAKLEEQEQNRLYLDQLVSMLKDRDPALLHLMNRSLVSGEPEEWC